MKSRLAIVGATILAVTVLNPGSLAIRAAHQAEPRDPNPQSQQAGGRQGGQSAQAPQSRDNNQRSRLPFWKDPAIVREIGLTPDQAKRIDTMWHERSKEMAGRAEELHKQEAELKRLISARTVSPDIIALQIDRVEAQRTMLYKSRTVMLYRMALVLTPEQNKNMEAIWARLFGFTGDGRPDSRGGR